MFRFTRTRLSAGADHALVVTGSAEQPIVIEQWNEQDHAIAIVREDALATLIWVSPAERPWRAPPAAKTHEIPCILF